MVTYPDGYRRHWTDIDEMQENGVDDIAFISAVIEKVARAYTIGPRKVYAAGISNGGFFAQRLAIEPEFSARIGAIASVAATMPMNLSQLEELSNPVSVMWIHGTDDPLVPFEGGRVRAGARRTILSATVSATKWAQLNGCSSTPAVSYLPDRSGDSTRVRVERFPQCNEGVEVVLYAVEGAVIRGRAVASICLKDSLARRVEILMQARRSLLSSNDIKQIESLFNGV